MFLRLKNWNGDLCEGFCDLGERESGLSCHDA